ncbi:MAG: hypothetical protein L0206_23390 [Actinobacteria bacterium]|nr:hypothetical protein [Actinomycetota bacterium]
MADAPHSPEPHEPADRHQHRGTVRRTPRWLVVLAIIIALHGVALIVLLHLTGAIGPGSH